MFFLIRSAVCIGIVVLMLPGNGGPSTVRDLETATRSAASAGLQHYCTDGGDCVGIGVKVAGWLAGGKAPSLRPVPTSVNTLEAADLVPAWSGPRLHPRG